MLRARRVAAAAAVAAVRALCSTAQRSAVRLVTFDATGTLFDVVGGSVGRHYADVAARLTGRTFDSRRLSLGFVTAFREVDAELPNFGYGKVETIAWWTRIIAETFKRADYHLSSSQARSATERLFDRFARAKFYDTFVETRFVLSSLRERGIRLGVISNFDERLKGVLDALGIGANFDFVIASREVGVLKPDAGAFRAALDAAGITDPSEAVHIGDNLRKDYEGARAAGMRAVLLDRKLRYLRHYFGGPDAAAAVGASGAAASDASTGADVFDPYPPFEPLGSWRTPSRHSDGTWPGIGRSRTRAPVLHEHLTVTPSAPAAQPSDATAAASASAAAAPAGPEQTRELFSVVEQMVPEPSGAPDAAAGPAASHAPGSLPPVGDIVTDLARFFDLLEQRGWIAPHGAASDTAAR